MYIRAPNYYRMIGCELEKRRLIWKRKGPQFNKFPITWMNHPDCTFGEVRTILLTGPSGSRYDYDNVR